MSLIGNLRLPVRLIAYLGGGFIGLMTLALSAEAGSEINTGYFGKVAIKGYDPVAYFVSGAATKGSEDHQLEWLGAYWHFSSAKNKGTFKSSPLKFVPQFGGYCSAGVGGGVLTSDIDPEAWKILDGKLYLNYAKSVGKMLNKHRIGKAEANWKTLREKAAQ